MGKITISTKGNNDDIVTIQCYGNIEKMKREDAIRQYLNWARCCEGCETWRYFNIYCQLLDGEMFCYDI